MKNAIKVRVIAMTPFAPGKAPSENCLGLINGTGVLSFSQFNFEQYGMTLHKWCNKPYSAKFWEMAGSYEDFTTYYKQRQLTKGVKLTIFNLNDKPMAFTETYPVIGSELEEHLPAATEKDFGIHFLMAPPRQLAEEFQDIKKSISFFTLTAAIDLLFRKDQAENVYAEPDSENHKACHLAETVGFSYLKEVHLSDKTASLFCYKKRR